MKTFDIEALPQAAVTAREAMNRFNSKAGEFVQAHAAALEAIRRANAVREELVEAHDAALDAVQLAITVATGIVAEHENDTPPPALPDPEPVDTAVLRSAA